MKTTDSAVPARRELAPIQPITLVTQVVDAIVKGAAEGLFPPGQRIVEAEVARRLNVSRVPIREALRLLESQGVVVNEPYRGMLMMDVDRQRAKETLSVRLALEQLAVEELRAAGRQDDLKGELLATVDEMVAAEHANEPFGISQLDMQFHRQIVHAAHNSTLVRAWEPLARQLIIITRLSANYKPLSSITEEHRLLADALCTWDDAPLKDLLREHVFAYLTEIDN